MGRSILQDFERSDPEHGKDFERSDQESFVAHSPFHPCYKSFAI